MDKKHYNLFLDDHRQPKDVKWIDLPPVEWIVVKTYDEFVNTIQKNGIPACISFDHDLGDEHYQEYFRANNGDKTIRYGNFKEKTGFECAKWLANFCVDTGTPLPLYYIHTLNGMGRMNIFAILESARKCIVPKT